MSTPLPNPVKNEENKGKKEGRERGRKERRERKKENISVYSFILGTLKDELLPFTKSQQ